MAVDMNSLAAITKGDPEKKIEVKRKWLTEVHAQLLAGQVAQRELEALQRAVRAHNQAIDEETARPADPFDRMGQKFDEIFGAPFGKRKKQ